MAETVRPYVVRMRVTRVPAKPSDPPYVDHEIARTEYAYNPLDASMQACLNVGFECQGARVTPLSIGVPEAKVAAAESEVIGAAIAGIDALLSTAELSPQPVADREDEA